MRAYFERIEDCRHRPLARFFGRLGINPSRHGWDGWLSTERAVPLAALAGDPELIKVIQDSAVRAFAETGSPIEQLWGLTDSHADPNDWRVVSDRAIGIRYTPLTTGRHQRVGTRERVRDVESRHPDRLQVRLNALATRVLFASDNTAVGVEYLDGARLYRAHAGPSAGPGERRQIRASREVILAGGAFNTPQLLMLSGVGPPTASPGTASRCGWTCRLGPEPAGPLRGRGGQPDGTRVERARGRAYSARATASTRSGPRAARGCTRRTARCSPS